MSGTTGEGVVARSTTVCESCGATNPADATFCQTCRAFVGWDRTSMIGAVRVEAATPEPSSAAAPTDEAPTDEASVETRVLPKVPASTDHHAGQPVDSAAVLDARAEQDRVSVPVSGASAEIALVITNRSDIVDGYEVDVGGAPDWLRVESTGVRLLPGTQERMVVRFRIESATLVAAGELTVRLRVRSLTQSPAHLIVPLVVVVPVVDAPVQLRTEPSVVRIRDVEVGRFVVVVDNSSANRPARVRLVGTDPELAVGFHFDPEVLTVGAGESTRVRLATTSRRPDPGTELSRSLTISATEGTRRVSAGATLVQSTSAVVEDPMIELTATPSLVRMRDDEAAVIRVSIDNRAGRRPVNLRLSANDPEGVMRVRWSTAELLLPPGAATDVELRLVGPVPEAGSAVTRSVTLTATDGRRVARTQVSLVHTASPSPMTTLTVQLDPSVLRLGSGRHGVARVLVDNRRGQTPAQVRLRGDDPENVVSFAFEPSEVSVGPGQVLASRVKVSAPRPPGGREVNRSVTIEATDGRTSVTTGGAIIQSVGDRRPWARVVLTLLGAAVMIIGGMLPLRAVSARSSFAVSVNAVAGLFNAQVDLVGLAQLVSFGLVIMVLGGLMAFGLTGRSGRLTRYSAVLAVLLTVALLVTVGVAGRDAAPGSGAIMIGLGAVLGYVGGLLARR